MLKIIAIVFLIGLFFRTVGKIVRLVFGSGTPSKTRHSWGGRASSSSNRRPTNGNINVDYVPKKGDKRGSDDYKGGDYVDYEEVK